MPRCKGLSLPYLAAESDVKNVWDLCRNKKILPWTIFSIPTVGESDVSLQRPTSIITTIADHGCRRQKWPPSTPQEALRSALTCQIDGGQPLEQAGIILGAVEGVYGPQNLPMLWRFIIAKTQERFEGHTHPQPPPKNTSACLGGYCPSIRGGGVERKASCGALGGYFCRRRP
jgi:hypothetical protein